MIFSYQSPPRCTNQCPIALRAPASRLTSPLWSRAQRDKALVSATPRNFASFRCSVCAQKDGQFDAQCTSFFELTVSVTLGAAHLQVLRLTKLLPNQYIPVYARAAQKANRSGRARARTGRYAGLAKVVRHAYTCCTT